MINGSLRVYRDRVMRRARRLETLVSMYGSANPIGTSNVMPAAWCVEAWAIGADGVVPWQTIGTERSWSEPDELSLFYPTRDGAIPSIRLKCFRYGQQLVEYLTMYCDVSGESRDAVGAAVLSEPGLTASTRMSSDDDAGASAFGADAHRSVTRLRERLGAWLDSKAPAARERWHDPRPPPPADEFRREIAPLQPPRP